MPNHVCKPRKMNCLSFGGSALDGLVASGSHVQGHVLRGATPLWKTAASQKNSPKVLVGSSSSL